MQQKVITGDCLSCESTFGIQYYVELASSDMPTYCPFCGELIEDITEEYIDEDESYEDDENWEE
jgi:hypothetical protein